MIHRFQDDESEAFEQAPRPGFIAALLRHRIPILIVLGVLLVACVTVIAILPHQFQSHLDVLVRNKLPASARASATSQETVDEERMQSELAILHSPELSAKVVEPDYPAKPDFTHTAADIKRHQTAVALFNQLLITSVAPDSNIIHVVVTAEDPHKAGEYAERLLDVFFASQAEVAQPTAPTAFFIAEANTAKSAWQEAQSTLDAHPPASASSEAGLQISALDHQIQRNDDEIEATIGRILAGERKLITIPARVLDVTNKSRSRNATMPPLSASQLNAMLAIYTDEQAILLTRPPTDGNAVSASLALASEIANTNSALQVARQSTSPEHDPAANRLWQSTTEKIAEDSTELKGLYATRTSLAAQRATFQGSNGSPQTRAATLKAAYRLADQRANEARIADAMDEQLRLNVAVVSRPSFSNTATSPSPWLYAAAIFLAVAFLAICLTLFAGMYSSQLDAHDREHDEYEEEDESSGSRYAEGYVPDSSEGNPQQQIPFPSRVRSNPSGAFLYAAPGSSVRPAHNPSETSPFPFPDPVFDSSPRAATLSEMLSQSADKQPTDKQPAAPEAHEEASELDVPSPPAQIFHPHQYDPASTATAEPADPEPDDLSANGFDARSAFSRSASGESHPAVPSFFAGPRSSTSSHAEVRTQDTRQKQESEGRSPYFYLEETPAPPAAEPASTPVVAAPFGGAPFVEPAQSEPAPAVAAIPTPEPEPIVTLPDPTPPWSAHTSEPKPSSLPPLSYWASVYGAAQTVVSASDVVPEPKAPQAEPAPEVMQAAAEPVLPEAPIELAPDPVLAPPTYTEPMYVASRFEAASEPLTVPVAQESAAPVELAPDPVLPVPTYSEPPYVPTRFEPASEPQPVPMAPEPAAPVPSAPVELTPDPVFAAPAYVEPAYVAPQASVPSDVHTPSIPEAATPAVAQPMVETSPAAPASHAKPAPAVPLVEPRALPQAFTSTLTPSPFLTSLSSTLSAPAFRFSPVSATPPVAEAPAPVPPAPVPVAPVPPAPAPPAPQPIAAQPVAPMPIPTATITPEPAIAEPKPILDPHSPWRIPEFAAAPTVPQPAPAQVPVASTPPQRPIQTPVQQAAHEEPVKTVPEQIREQFQEQFPDQPQQPRKESPAAAPTHPALVRDPELVLSYGSSPDIELVPDPVLTPVKLPYQLQPREEAAQEPVVPEPKLPSQPAAPAQTFHAELPELPEFPLYRPPSKSIPPPAASAAPVRTPEPAPAPLPPAPPPVSDRRAVPRSSFEPTSIRTSDRPQTYGDMVRALVFPEEFAPFVPRVRPTALPPRPAAEFTPDPRPVLPPAPPPAPTPAPAPAPVQTAPSTPVDDDAPPFFYARKSAPATPTAPPAPLPPPEPVFTTPPPQDNFETLQNFIRRPSVPLQPAPAPNYADDRTTYRPAQPPAPPQTNDRDNQDDRTTYRPAAAAATPPRPAQTPQPRSSWIDIAPPPPTEADDPHKRAPDRISAIRDGGSRVYPAVDKSGVRLTPSQRMKRSRPVPTYDKDGNVSYADYFNEQKNRE